MWKFLVKNQSIEVIEREIIAADQIAFVTLKFVFDGDWKKFHKVVQFSQCDETYNLVLGTDGNSCLLPAELHEGAVKMSVFGYDAENTSGLRATTVPITLHIRPSGFVGDGSTPIPPTPDLYQQLLDKMVQGVDGKSAYEIAKEHGYSGTEDQWLASLKGETGATGKTGKKGADGLSAYEIAQRNGYKDSEEEWLKSLHGKDGITPDMSEYPKTNEVESLISESVSTISEQAHTHENKEILDLITEETFVENKQFTDWVKEKIHTLDESINNFSNTAHTHENKSTLDQITDEILADIAGISEFKKTIKSELQDVKDAVEPILTQLQELVNANSERIDVNDREIASIQSILIDLQQQIDNISGGTIITLFQSDNDALSHFGDIIYTYYNSGFNSLKGFAQAHPNFCSANNNYALSYNQTDFNWAGEILTMCLTPFHADENCSILFCYNSGASQSGEMYLIAADPARSGSDAAQFIQTHIAENKVTKLDFQWLRSNDFISLIIPCRNIPSGEYYLAWKGVSDNTHPQIKTVKILKE